MTAASPISEITLDTLFQWLEDRRPLRLVDIREREEIECFGRIPGARVCDSGLSLQLLRQLSGHCEEIVLYCHSGQRSRELCAQLSGTVPTAVHSLAGGIRTWLEHAHPVIFPEPERA